MWVTVIITSALLYMIFKHCRNQFKSSKVYPPGPPLLPILGNCLSLWYRLKIDKFRYKVWQSWREQYGDILGLKFGTFNMVVVSGKDLIKEVSSREVFDGRPDAFFYTLRSFGKKLGIVFADGASWTATRRVVLKYLKNFGFGTGYMQTIIEDECQALTLKLTSQSGVPILANDIFNLTIVNILWQIVGGKRYDLNDIRLQEICNNITETFQVVDMSGGLLNFMPFLRYIIPDFIGYTKLMKLHEALHTFLRDIIQEHQGTVNTSNPRDVIDAFLIEKMERKDGAFSDEELQVVCRDLLEAGMETVNNTAGFMLLYLCLNNEVQRRVQSEIDEVIGQLKPPTFKDRNRRELEYQSEQKIKIIKKMLLT